MAKTPMTTKQVQEKYECEDCRTGVCDCVESHTCSFRCPDCDGRIWFDGDLQDSPQNYVCPYSDCGLQQFNLWSKGTANG